MYILLKGGQGVRFRVNDECRAIMVFDDSSEHEVTHDDDDNADREDRLVLLVLLRHPGLLLLPLL